MNTYLELWNCTFKCLWGSSREITCYSQLGKKRFLLSKTNYRRFLRLSKVTWEPLTGNNITSHVNWNFILTEQNFQIKLQFSPFRIWLVLTFNLSGASWFLIVCLNGLHFRSHDVSKNSNCVGEKIGKNNFQWLFFQHEKRKITEREKKNHIRSLSKQRRYLFQGSL